MGARPGRWIAAIAAVLLAGCATAQQAPDPLGAERARLFLTRTGFAPSEAETARFAMLTHAEAVDRVLAETNPVAARPAPAWVDEANIPPRDLRLMGEDALKAERRRQVQHGLELRGWWLQEMAATPTPLTERLTLFWHNHFVSSQRKVRYATLMYRQNVLLRTHAAGNFGTLLHAVARDPAMLIYLDSATNRRDAPNENFAREVMELFTLGEGRYTEADVKQAARAFSGWSVDLERATFVFRARQHDGGEKTVLGRRGNWQGDDVLDILLAQPATAEFIVRKLWREFVSPRPDEARVARIADTLRASRYELKPALRELLLQPELLARDEDNALVKSPVELAIGLVRQSGGAIAHPAALAVRVAAMGQDLFGPPNVRGWPGGEAWINTQTLLARKQFIDAALARTAPANASVAMGAGERSPMNDADAADPARPFARAMQALARVPAVQIDAGGWLKSAGGATERRIGAEGTAALARRLLVLPPANATAPDALGGDTLRALLLDPVYQLK